MRLSFRPALLACLQIVIVAGFLATAGLGLLISQHRYVHSTLALVDMSPAALGRGAAAIVRGRVAGQTTAPNGGGVVTLTTVDVGSVYKGPASVGALVIRTQGGTFGSVTEVAEDQATFRPGSEVVVFLFAQTDGYHVLAGFQGRYFVEGGAAWNEKESLPLVTLIDAASSR